MHGGISREEAWNLLCEWTASESLQRHMLAVEAAMRAYARRLGGEEELWGLAGLLHDLDWERHPSLVDGHPRYAMRELERRSCPPELVRAIGAHADEMGLARETPMERALYAVDELCGFIVACAHVRPEGLRGMTAKSVRKKLKQASFAAAVDREQIRRGAEELGVELEDHLAFTIAALAEREDELMPARGEHDAD